MNLTEDEFVNWITGGHIMFDLFEGRNDAYPLARKWVDEWLRDGHFIVEKAQLDRVRTLMSEFDPRVYGASSEMGKDLVNSFSTLIENHLAIRESNIGFGLAPLLFTWNFQRFRTYLERGKKVNLSEYFADLGQHFASLRLRLDVLKGRDLFDEDEPKADVRELYETVNDCLKTLGVGNNEPVGTAKILHIMAPSLLPIIDNPIAEAISLKQKNESLGYAAYRNWITRLRNGLAPYSKIIPKLESQHSLTILKLVDEALYVMSSMTLKYRVSELGL